MEEYTKKVMEQFKHPKNIGEIKNADGVGKVGNQQCGDVMWCYIKVGKNKQGEDVIKDVKVKTFGCLPPEEKVVLGSGGWADISSVKINDSVINDFGKETRISKTFEIGYSGPILEIVPFISPFNSFSVTPEHPILCVKRKWFKTRSQKPNSNWPKILDRSFLPRKPEFVEAKNLEIGDYLVFSFNRKIKDNVFFTKEWMRLIGYYLSEGHIAAKGSVVAFSFNRNEIKLIDEVSNTIHKIMGKKCSKRTRENVTEVYVCSRNLARALSSFAGKLAREKELSSEIMLLPPKKQLEIVNTFYMGDGDATVRRINNTPTYRLATASENLAVQLQELLARNGVFSSIVKRQRLKKHFIGEREINGKDIYIVSFKKERKHKFVHAKGYTFLVPIKRIEKNHYRGYVHNLHVEKEPDSYLVRGFAVHNCVAAISTSSIMTELVKGKTLDEALKITKDDVAKKLGGLPPHKLHCSVLSMDALKKAVEDYKRKSKK